MPKSTPAAYATVAPVRPSLRMSPAELATEPARSSGREKAVRSMRSWLVASLRAPAGKEVGLIQAFDKREGESTHLYEEVLVELAKMPEEDSNLHPVIPDQALNPVTRVSDTSYASVSSRTSGNLDAMDATARVRRRGGPGRDPAVGAVPALRAPDRQRPLGLAQPLAYSSAARDSNSNPTKRSSPTTHASWPGSMT